MASRSRERGTILLAAGSLLTALLISACSSSTGTGYLAQSVAVADLDGDGRPDILAVAERGSNEMRWWRNEGKKKRRVGRSNLE